MVTSAVIITSIDLDDGSDGSKGNGVQKSRKPATKRAGVNKTTPLPPIENAKTTVEASLEKEIEKEISTLNWRRPRKINFILLSTHAMRLKVRPPLPTKSIL